MVGLRDGLIDQTNTKSNVVAVKIQRVGWLTHAFVDDVHNQAEPGLLKIVGVG